MLVVDFWISGLGSGVGHALYTLHLTASFLWGSISSWAFCWGLHHHRLCLGTLLFGILDGSWVWVGAHG